MKGILFKPDMIQAIIEGRKTNTRRVEAGLREINQEPDEWILYSSTLTQFGSRFLFVNEKHEGLTDVCKPRYEVGETVYIKEAFMFKAGADIRELDVGTPRECFLGKPPFYLYRLDNTEETRDYERYYKWRSPLMMPQKAARYFIMIEQVGAERVQGITIVDIRSEGIGQEWLDAKSLFIDTWDSINPKYPWESNPWVFPYTFSLKEGK